MHEHTMESVITILIGLLMISLLGETGVLIIISSGIYFFIHKISIHEFNKFIIKNIKTLLMLFFITEKKNEEIANDILENTIVIGKQIKKEVSKQIKQMKLDISEYSNNAIKDYINGVISETLLIRNNFNEDEIIDKVVLNMDISYQGVIEQINNNILENNSILISHITELINNYMKNSKEVDESINIEINKAIDTGISEYNKQIEDIINVQISNLKNEVENNIDKQLDSLKTELNSKNIDIDVLDERLKKHSSNSLAKYRKQSNNDMNKALGVITKNFSKLKEEINKNNLNPEILNTLKEIKENDLVSLQENIDQTLKIVKNLAEYNINNFEIIKNEKIREKLEEAFDLATEEINIISPWINYHVINKTGIKNRIYKSLKSGTKIRIKYGIKDNKYYDDDNRNENTEKIVKELEESFPISRFNLKFKKSNTHSKILICDEKFAIIGSFNFLSFDGKYVHDTREEISAIITDSNIIKELRKMEFNF